MNNKLYKILSTISITGVFIVVALLVSSITSLINLNYIFGGILAIIAVLCISCIFSLPWVKLLEEKRNKILSIIFLSFIVICALLWIVFVIMVMIKTGKDEDLKKLELNLLRFSIILTIQVLVASTISGVIIRYKKSMIAFQVITYLSNFIVDLYFTLLLITIKVSNDGLSFKTVPDFMGSKFILTILIIALLYVMLSNTIMKIIDKKKIKSIIDEQNVNENKLELNKKELSEDIELKLKKIKDLLDNNLISQEDYENKKKELLKDI
ncbi:MAG: hypothetical protein IJX17_04665 [Clostridia bacterium]|nr:hypothetical protein [Clostridia bacterium]